MDKINWKQEHVLVTGADGFIGSHIAKALVERGATVVTIVRDIKKRSNIDLLELRDKITVIHGDLVSFKDCERAVNEYDISFCFHIAAQAIVGPANRSPLSTFESNIKGTWNMLEVCRTHATVKGLIVASSDKAYGQQEKLPYTEDSPLHGYYPYDASKACAEMLARCYYKTYGLPLAVTRNANTYGPADMNVSRIIPDVITTVLKGETPLIRSDGTPERDYLYIQDAVDAYLLLAENLHRKDVQGEAFNFGTGQPVSVLTLYKKIVALMNTDVKPKILGSAPHEIDRQYLDCTKVKKTLRWEPRFSLDEGLKQTIAWYTRFHKNQQQQ